MSVVPLVAFIASLVAAAQDSVRQPDSPTARSGIAGVVKDSSGAALPGVTVEAASSALSEKVRAVVTDGEGQYKIGDLPAGIYTVTFSLPGFESLKRDGVELPAGFTATVNAELNVSAHIETVTVTARERAEDLQEVPQSVAASTADDLEAQSIQRLSDLGQVTPNFLYGQKIQSGSSAGQIYIRGIGQQDTNVQFSPGVGIYVDGVYLGRAQANDLDMADVERVEVLYGPQGTLFGKNSDGGAISVVTKRPDISAAGPDGTLELQTGNFGRFDARGVLNIPLMTDRAALQLSAASWRQDGYSVRTNGQDQANQNRGAGRIQLLLKPADNLEVVLGIDGTIFDEHSGAYRLVAVREDSALPRLYASTPVPYDNRWVTASDFQYNGAGPNKNSGNVWGPSLTLSWERPWATLKSITAYRKLHVESDFDPDGAPLAILDVFNTIAQHQISQEFQATGTSFERRLHWVAGLYYFRERAQDIQPLNIALEIFHGAANLSYNNYVVNSNYAAYGQGTFDLTKRLKLTAGGRLSADTVNAQREQVGYPIPIVQQPLVYRSAHWVSFLPRVGLDYQWTPKVMTYVSVAEGSKSGGFNGRASSIAEFTQFEPEKVWAYEVGLRSEWFNQRMRLNVTGYYSDYKDFQIQLNRSMTDPVTGRPVAFSFVGNMPKATIKGGELALTVLPTTRLKLSAGLGITDGRYITVIPGAPVTTESQFVNAPRNTFTVGADYVAGMRKVGQVAGHIEGIHKSTVQYDYGNSPLVAQAPYGLLNARVTWQPPESRVSFFLFGTNLTDTHYAVGGLDDGPGGSLGEVVKLMGPPREWGMGAAFNLGSRRTGGRPAR
jgi:iron complex outermembrane receptor protein